MKNQFHEYFQVEVPDFFKEEWTKVDTVFSSENTLSFFLNRIHFEGWDYGHEIGLLTKNKIEFDFEDKENKVKIYQLEEVQLEEETLKEIFNFHKAIFFKVIRKTKYPYSGKVIVHEFEDVSWDDFLSCEKKFLIVPLFFDETGYKIKFVNVDEPPQSSLVFGQQADRIKQEGIIRCDDLIYRLLEETEDEFIVSRVHCSFMVKRQKEERCYLNKEHCLFFDVPWRFIEQASLLSFLFWNFEAALRQRKVTNLIFVKENMDINLFLEATTLPAVDNKRNYDALETLGDSVLKFQVSKYLYFHHTKDSPYKLSMDRNSLVSNKYLGEVAIWLGIHNHVRSTFLKKEWNPPSSHKKDRIDLTPKIMADVVEAIIGACYICDPFSSYYFISTVIIKKKDHSMPTKKPYRIDSVELEEMEKIIGYNFNNIKLLDQARTHDSIPGKNYQRMEFLGDAIVGLLITDRLYKASFSSRKISCLRQMLVSNDIFAIIAIKSGLHHFVKHKDPEFTFKVDDFISSVSSFDFEDIRKMLIRGIDGPKVLSDVFEAVLTAVFLDSQSLDCLFDLKIVNEFLFPFLKWISEKESRMYVHPEISLSELISSRACTGFTIEDKTVNGVCSHTGLFHDHPFWKTTSEKRLAKREISLVALELLDQ
jgi:dsRNA-specific ribonuclease